MSAQTSELLASTTEINRPSANYIPCIWGDRFIAYAPDDSLMKIDEMLQHIHKNYKDDLHNDDHDLNTTALCFRLLRQQGYNISCDVFDRFKDNEGGRIFKESLINDVAGMLSLYEAANHRVYAEYVLDEALNFTSTHLQSKQSQISPPLSEQAAQALKQPIC